MKAIYFAFSGCMYALAGQAQTSDTLIHIVPRIYDEKAVPLLPDPKWLAQHKAGKVYNLPLDVMPCFVPDLKKSIPIPTKRLHPGHAVMPNHNPK